MPEMSHVKNVAIVGASGNVGSHITSALLKTGNHNITAITRTESSSTFPDGVTKKTVDYDSPATLASALHGQDALIISLSGRSSIEATEAKLIHAAAEAGVKWIFPNEWSPDTANEGLVKDINFLFQAKVNTRKLIETLDKCAYTAVVTGFWYEYSLAKAASWGFDFAKREVTFFDEGESKISTSTSAHVGQAVAALVSLPLHSGDGTACLETFRNKVVYTRSFTVSQKDMLASACRVTGTKESDWKVTKDNAKERFELGQKQVKEGNFAGFGKVLYTRVFFPGDGDFEHSKGTIDEALGLPREDLDEATKAAVDQQLAAGSSGGH